MTEWRKSSYSGYNGNCVEVGWRKSSHSMANGNCAEVAQDGGRVLVRDSKDLPGPVLEFSTAEWVAFLERMKDGIPTKQDDVTEVPLDELAKPRKRKGFNSAI